MKKKKKKRPERIADISRNWPPTEEDSQEWLNSADSSYVAARILYHEFSKCYRAAQLPGHSTFLQDDIFSAFHLSIEKYLKGYLINKASNPRVNYKLEFLERCIKAANFPLIHDLEKLVRRCKSVDPDFKELQTERYRSILLFLPSFVDRRYPKNISETLIEPPTRSSDELRDLCDEIVCFVRNKIDLGNRLKECLLNQCMNPQYYQNYSEFRRIKDIISEKNKSIHIFKFS